MVKVEILEELLHNKNEDLLMQICQLKSLKGGAVQMEKEMFGAVFRSIKGIPFAVTYWDGQTEQYGISEGTDLPFRIIFNQPLNLLEMIADPETMFGEAYMDQKVDVEGDFSALLNLLLCNEDVFKESGTHGFFRHLIKSSRARPVHEQKENVETSYNLDSDFFKLWLDSTLSYSCAYFKSPDDTLEQAQLQKIDHILSKLNLKESETLLDIGSGWGWLIIRAARKYGVRALGITLSEEEEAKTRKRIEHEGLEDRVEVRLADYRDLAVQGLVFDKILSVGMFKYVGKNYIPAYFQCLQKMLKPGGLSLLHTITRSRESATATWLEKYIFPQGYIPSLREIVWMLPDHVFHLIDAESLRLHYALTTACWAENFEKAAGKVRDRYGEHFVRMWRLYLLGCSNSFKCSGLDVHQLLFSKGVCNELPLVRE
jgi:cyclopropane-fatty-acyl-phospholipid synthase